MDRHSSLIGTCIEAVCGFFDRSFFDRSFFHVDLSASLKVLDDRSTGAVCVNRRNQSLRLVCLVAGMCFLLPPLAMGQSVPSAIEVIPNLPVPRLIKVDGAVNDALGHPRSGVVGLTFSVYAEQHGGATLWMETQNVE